MRQYYAQPRNSFWMIMGALFEAGPSRSYEERCQRLMDRGVAVWDVCAAASRKGSLDAAIDAHSVQANDFAGFFSVHTELRQIAFNGVTAATLFKQHVLPKLTADHRKLPTVTLPSTSAAHAALSLKDKLAQWQVITKKLQATSSGRRA
jgi:hypoxanthine-DNA glycosylase